MQKPLTHLVALATILLAKSTAAALFDDDKLSRLDPVYVDECGSCHVPYPAALLRADSWRLLLDGLDRHFKADATPDSANVTAITHYLLKNAGVKNAADTGPLPEKISKSRWFVQKHAHVRHGDRWPRVKSMSNCGACHTEAQQGRYLPMVPRKY